MKMSTLETYGLSVCFVAAIALAIALCMLLYTLVHLFSPLFALDKWDYQRRESAFQFLLQTNRHEAAKLLVKVVIFIVIPGRERPVFRRRGSSNLSDSLRPQDGVPPDGSLTTRNTTWQKLGKSA